MERSLSFKYGREVKFELFIMLTLFCRDPYVSKWDHPRGVYYRLAHGIMIVYDITNQESFNNVKSWFIETERFDFSFLLLCVLIMLFSDMV